jgi:hypothetical protein
MENSGVSSKRAMLSEKLQPGFENCKTTVAKVNYVINFIGVWLFRLRKFVLAAPVIYYALKIAAYNREHLPEQVGINLQATGEFATMISRTMAVNGPLMLTFGCLLMMFFSRKALYSWAISIFTLVLPILLLVSNLYPA